MKLINSFAGVSHFHSYLTVPLIGRNIDRNFSFEGKFDCISYYVYQNLAQTLLILKNEVRDLIQDVHAEE